VTAEISGHSFSFAFDFFPFLFLDFLPGFNFSPFLTQSGTMSAGSYCPFSVARQENDHRDSYKSSLHDKSLLAKAPTIEKGIDRKSTADSHPVTSGLSGSNHRC
jgi:hypothetical protein